MPSFPSLPHARARAYLFIYLVQRHLLSSSPLYRSAVLIHVCKEGEEGRGEEKGLRIPIISPLLGVRSNVHVLGNCLAGVDGLERLIGGWEMVWEW